MDSQARYWCGLSLRFSSGSSPHPSQCRHCVPSWRFLALSSRPKKALPFTCQGKSSSTREIRQQLSPTRHANSERLCDSTTRVLSLRSSVVTCNSSAAFTTEEGQKQGTKLVKYQVKELLESNSTLLSHAFRNTSLGPLRFQPTRSHI